MRRVITIVAVALLVCTAAVAPAVAQTDSDEGGFFTDLVDGDDSEEDDGSLAAAVAERAAGVYGQAARLRASVSIPFVDEETSDQNASTYAADATTSFNEHNETLTAIANANVEGSTDNDVWAVYFHQKDEGNVTRYLVADVVDGEYQNGRMLTPEEFEATNRTQDHYLSLDWYASKQADDELEAFAEEFGAEGERNVSRTYAAKLYAEYGSGVESDALGGEEGE